MLFFHNGLRWIIQDLFNLRMNYTLRLWHVNPLSISSRNLHPFGKLWKRMFQEVILEKESANNIC
jgi:hypothetical protein